MQPSDVDLADIQGLVRFGHGRLTEACIFLLRITDPVAAGSWLMRAPITTAEDIMPLPKTALQVAFTRYGLQALGLPAATIAGFSDEFIAGMAGEESRSRRLGDVGANAPANWQWGRSDNPPHLAIFLYAAAGALENGKTAIKGPLWAAGFAEQACLPTSDMKGREPFGFVDGISQPALDWQRERKAGSDAQPVYGNLLALGEFLLGYPNEYGRYTDRPLIDPAADPPAANLPPAEEVAGFRDLGRNGTYLVLRQLRQEVTGFWQFVDKQTGSQPDARRHLAEAMVGRGLAGDPLLPITKDPIDGIGPDPADIKLNRFTYQADSAGTRCPFGAHIRRANPRTADLPDGATGFLSRLIRVFGFGRKTIRDDMVASSRFHRILRRGREYGTFRPPEEALRPGQPEGECGLQFVGLGANISRQFEFVQNAWIMAATFNGLADESDPLLGNRKSFTGRASDGFSIPQQGGPPRRIAGLPQFVTVRGGAYFFLPGIRALRYIAAAAQK